ncbi:MAG: hypothetical protein RLZZ416_586 [Candidatus Parcubacteria bacterium]|jgi:hypothetical protein
MRRNEDKKEAKKEVGGGWKKMRVTSKKCRKK